MSKVIANRYELIRKSTETNNLQVVDGWIAIDLQSASGDAIHIQLLHQKMQNEMIHFIFLERAKEFSRLSHPRLPRLLDYGYDRVVSVYYLVYERIPGKQLSQVINNTSLPIGWCLDTLLEICDALIYLQTYGIAHGSLYTENILLNAEGNLPLIVSEWGLLNIAMLFVIRTDSDIDIDLHKESIEYDIMGLGEIATDLLTNRKRISLSSLSPSIKNFIDRCQNKKALYKSAIEARNDLLKSKAEYLSQTNHHLLLTKGVATRLQEMSFIPKVELYLAADLINEELDKEVFGRSAPSDQDTLYYMTTPRFRLLCRRDRSGPDRNLVVVATECPTPIEMDSERERSFLVTASLKAVISTDKIPLATGQLDEFLRTLDEHRYESQSAKQAGFSRRDQLDAWTKVLELQRHRLNEFKLPYKRWELADNGATLLVELRTETDNIGLIGEVELQMPIIGSKKTMRVGFYEDLNGNQLKIGLASDVAVDKIAQSGDITRDYTQLKSILDRQQQAIRRLKNGETINPSLLDLLIHPEKLVTNSLSLSHFLDEELDQSQKDSVNHALATNDIFLIQGPPGTGKTTAIVEIVRQILNSNSQARVLIASQSNVAVDHALLSLLKNEPKLRPMVVRIGREDKVDAAKDILLDQQMLRWLDQIKQRSFDYINQKQAGLAIDVDLIECLRIASECDTYQVRLQQLGPEIKKFENELKNLRKKLDVLENLISKLETFRRRATESLKTIAFGDDDFQRLLLDFSTSYIAWGEQFLHESDKQMYLSIQRVELQEKIKSLSNELNSLESQIHASQSLVSEILIDKFQVSINEFDKQRAFIVQRVSEQRNAALRLARLQKISHDWNKQLANAASKFTSTYLSRSRVIGATCIGIAAKGDASELDFDWVIIDEAGRATHPEIIVPMVRGRKIVLVGDHKQLPPVLDQDLPNDVLDKIGVKLSDIETSLFQEMINTTNDSSKSTLTIQYRMHPAIGNLISNCFYEGRLQHGSTVANHDHGLSWCKTPVIWYSTCNYQHKFEQREGSSYRNLAEAEIIHKLLDKLESDLEKRGVSKRIGIITGYTAQKMLLRQLLLNTNNNYWPHLELEVNTVDAYQGREMDYIIYSFVRSNSKGTIGFLRDSRRVNVALSRARELLMIVGDHQTAETAIANGHENPFFTVIKYIRQHPDQCSLEEKTL